MYVYICVCIYTYIHTYIYMQQREDLKAHRECIHETLEHEVQQLQVRVQQDDADFKDVYSKYREALDELVCISYVMYACVYVCL